MYSKKYGLLEKFCSVLSAKRKVISCLFFGVAISIFVFTIFFSNNPFTNINGIIVDNYSWSFSTTYSSELQNSTETNQKKTEFSELNLGNTHEVNLTEKDKNSTFFVHTSILDETHEKNSSVFVFSDKNMDFSRDDDDDREERVSLRNHKYRRYGDVNDLSNCDIFDGKWVKIDEENTSYYPVSSCPYIDKDFDCHLNGRPDYDLLKWRWQPSGCNIPRLNTNDFLERMRGKRLVFVGDSLNRNMWESLVCILRHNIVDKSRVFEISGKTEFKKKGVYSFRYEDYNCSIDFVNAPFLVRQSYVEGKNGSMETLRLDLIDQVSSVYHDADIIVFNSGHWWTHDKTSKGENYYQEGNHVYPKLQAIEAYNKALSTWARWIDKNINVNRTQVLFRGYSVTHFRGGQWNSGGQCHKETEPILNETYLEKYPTKMEVLESVLQRMRTPVLYLNISKLTDYRKDAHPSIYRKEYKTVEEKVAAEMSQDCSHWCLPGVPDTWNELLYASLLKAGVSSWKI